MAKSDKNLLPDVSDQEALAKWLEDKPRPLVVAFAARVALLSLPYLGSLPNEYWKEKWGGQVIMTIYRAMLVTWATSKFGSQAGLLAAANAPAPIDVDVNADSVFGALRVAKSAKNYGEYAAIVVSRLLQMAKSSDEKKQMRERLRLELESISSAEVASSGTTTYLLRDIWPENKLPRNLQNKLHKMTVSLIHREEGWHVWNDWVAMRLSGGSDWASAVYDELLKWNFEWDQDPILVNLNISTLIALNSEPLETKSRDESKPRDQYQSRPLRHDVIDTASPPAEVNADIKDLLAKAGGDDILKQQASNYRFQVRDGKLPATNEIGPPIDVALAETTRKELVRKCTETLEKLRDNHADDDMSAPLIALLDLISVPVEAINPGLLQSRARSLQALAAAYDHTDAGIQDSIRLKIRDASLTAMDMRDCYRSVVEIQTNRDALGLLDGKADETAKRLDTLTEKLHEFDLLDASAIAAFEENRRILSNLQSMAKRVPAVSGQQKAEYVQGVAARALDMRNAMSALAQEVNSIEFAAAGDSGESSKPRRTVKSEVGGFLGDAWEEMRKQGPKGAGEGFRKITSGTVRKAPGFVMIAALYLLTGDWALIALAVPFLRSQADRVKDIAENAMKKASKVGVEEVEAEPKPTALRAASKPRTKAKAAARVRKGVVEKKQLKERKTKRINTE